MPRSSSGGAPSAPARAPVTAVLGPTNTGKTHLAIERMLAYPSGMIGLPLRLLAREVYDRVVAQKGAAAAALVTGEEKIAPATARYWICTVEAMPVDRPVDFVAVDEIQLCADPERGHVFTSRLLRARGAEETMLLGSDAMRPLVSRLLTNPRFVSRPRFSKLSYAGPKKLSRLPRRSAIVAFSADAVYAIAELVRRHRGGAAVVLGALSPRTRNAQVALYQSGEVDFLVATDAIGMGLNMDVDHVAFAAARKFDGRRMRPLSRAEIAQIAGRAGRHMNDGSFGVTGECGPFDADDAAAVEEHVFDPVRTAFWRNEDLSFASPAALVRTLDAPAPAPGLQRPAHAGDAAALHRLLRDEAVAARAAGGGDALKLLWDVCQIPDFRKVSADVHARLLGEIYAHLTGPAQVIAEDWIAAQVARLDRTDGDVDALSQRIAHVRTWTFVANRSIWLQNATYWQDRTRAIENTLSDALHERLTRRFVDRRTSVLMRRLRDEAPLLAGVTGEGEVVVEGQFVGRLKGFQFVPDPRAKGVHGKALRAAALRALKPEIAARAARLANADAAELRLDAEGLIHWRESVVGRLARGSAPLQPKTVLVDEDLLSAHLRPRIRDRLEAFAARRIAKVLEPLVKLERAVAGRGGEPVDGLARGLGFQLIEALGALPRKAVASDVRALDQAERGKLRKFGVRFGEQAIFLPALLKPAPAELRVLLWALWTGNDPAAFHAPGAGLTSIANDPARPAAYYYAAGFRPCGRRAVRLDMLERLSELIRKARTEAAREEAPAQPAAVGAAPHASSAEASGDPAPASPQAASTPEAPSEAAAVSDAPAKAAAEKPAAPAKAAAADRFRPTPEMMSLMGCSGDDFEAILAALGYRKDSAGEASEATAAMWRVAPKRQAGKRAGGRRAGAKVGETARGRGEHKTSEPRKRPRQAAKSDEPHAKSAGPKKPGGKAAKPRRRERPVDPDSPFAVLQVLKERKSAEDGAAPSEGPAP